MRTNSVEIKAVDFRYEYITSSWENTIFLETENNRISNRLETIEIDGESYELKKVRRDSQGQLPPGILHERLIDHP